MVEPESNESPDQELQTGDESIDRTDEFLARFLPWALSLMAHVAIVVLAFFVIWSVVQSSEEEEEPIIPIARLSKTPGAPVKMRATQQKTRTKSSRRSAVRTNNQGVAWALFPPAQNQCATTTWRRLGLGLYV